MLQMKHILFPLDFSDRCCRAVGFVGAMASRFGAKVTLLSVAPNFSSSGLGDPVGIVTLDSQEILDDLKARLDGALLKEFAHLRVERVAALGDPGTVITSFAEAHGVDLIMMPTHGYGPFRTLLLGSTAAKVLHDSMCPVWTAAHTDDPPVREHIQCKNILCAIEPLPKSIPTLQWAAELSKATGASLRLVHVIPGAHTWAEERFDRQFEEDLRKEAREKITALQESAGVDAPLCVTTGKIPDGVREEARRHGSDLVVIGRGTLHERLGRLRTEAYGIIRQAPCPVLSL